MKAGRWLRPDSIPVNDRKCVLHVCQVLEDECHFVLECRMYTELRRKYISRNHWHRPSMFKFVELINTSNTRYLKNSGAFVYQPFKTRVVKISSVNRGTQGRRRHFTHVFRSFQWTRLPMGLCNAVATFQRHDACITRFRIGGGYCLPWWHHRPGDQFQWHSQLCEMFLTVSGYTIWSSNPGNATFSMKRWNCWANWSVEKVPQWLQIN